MPWNRRKTDRTLTEATVVLVVSSTTIRRAERRITACQHCDRTADTPFRHLLARVTLSQDRLIEYFLPEPAHCPLCDNPVLEYTLVETA